MTEPDFSGKRIFLIGLPGAGKTTLGRTLALDLGWPFLDLDAEIEAHTGRSIGEVFEDEGEDFFRLLEARVLRQVGTATPVVLATGGGTPCFHDSLDWLLAHGTVVWLDVAPAAIIGRLVAASAAPLARRPLMAVAAAASPKATETALSALLAQTLEARTPFYARAPHRLAGTEATAAGLRARLGL